MKRSFRTFAFAAAVILSGCAAFDETPYPVEKAPALKSFNGQFLEDNDTKTSLGTGNSVLWSDNDSISVFANGNAARFKASWISENKSQARFVGTIGDATEYYALYPYNSGASISSGVISTTLPSVQTATEGSFANKTNISVAKTTGNEFAFKNACAILSITVNNDNIQSVELTSDVALTGSASITVGTNGTPSVQVNSGVKSVKLTGGLTNGKKYFMTVFPGNHANGFTLCFTDNEGNRAIYTNSTACNISINKDINLGSITIASTKWIGPAANYNTTQVCGIYDIEKDVALYSYKKYYDQLALTVESTKSFRIQNPNEDKYLEIYGIPLTVKAGDKFNGRLIQNYLESLEWNTAKEFTVEKVNAEGYVWLTDKEGNGYVIKYDSL